MFLGIADFELFMSHNRFIENRSSLKFHPEHNHVVSVLDILWHSQIMLQCFLNNAVCIAVTGSSSGAF